ncbi:MAG TPA: protein kinase [Pirellulales bacterium]|nr:protein kinase [Pirellulales bacterium]
MTAINTQCPPESVLSDFGLGKLDAASAETISRHIETCADCCRRVADISGDSFVGRLRQVGHPPAGRRERTYVPGDSLANAANSTDGSTVREDGLPRPSRTKDHHGGQDGLGSPSSVSAPPELTNHPDYELIKELGQGGMGTVYLAKNRMMDRLEVLKVISKALLDRPGALERFQQEIRSAAKLAHPNIVAAYSVLRPGDLLVFAMEYVKGQDLSQVVKGRGPLPVANAAFYIHQVANGLQHAFEKGMVHRDIKPNNLMLAIDGKKHVVKILDFGLAKATSEKGAESGLTKSGQMLGTPDYVAPEQTLDAHNADIRADIYSLGCTLYFLLSGGPPFEEQSLYAILEAHHKRDPKPLNLVRPDVPVELAAAVAKMMAKDPTKRYQTPVEVAKALVPFFKPGQSSAAPAESAMSDTHGANAAMHGIAAATAPPRIADPLSPTSDATDISIASAAFSNNFSVSIDTHRHIGKKRGLLSSLPPWQRWTAAGFAALVLCLGVIVIIRNQKGEEVARFKVPEKGSMEVKPDDSLGDGSRPAAPDDATNLSPTSPVPSRAPTGAPAMVDSREVQQASSKALGNTRARNATQDGLAAMLNAVERPGPLGVIAEKLVIHNAHDGKQNDLGTLECNVKLLAGDREIWTKQSVVVPWAANEDRSVTLPLPPERFERVRVEITKWQKVAGGLAEIEVISADGRNLALGCPALSTSSFDERLSPEQVTDGITTTAETGIGAWYLPRAAPGWVEVDLSLPRATDLDGVNADKLVIWNQHDGANNNHGTLECDVRLESHANEVWTKSALEVPWSPGEDRSVAIDLPPKRFDRVRVEVTKWQNRGGGLAEIQILSADGRNLALDCPAVASGIADNGRSGRHVTDGILSSQAERVGYWLLPDQRRGWVEIDLACLDTIYGGACRQLGLALALVDGDWQRGLPWLARGDDPTLRRLAFADSQDRNDAADQLSLGDAWWNLAQMLEGPAKKRLLARSLWRYRQALGNLSGFRKAEVQARIDQTLPGLQERHFLYFMPETEFTLGGSLREPVSVNGVRSFYGLFMHPATKKPSHAAYHLGKRYRRLHGAAAIRDSAGGVAATAMTFRIVGDGRELWTSRPLKQSGSSDPFDVDLTGVDKLELFVDCPGDAGCCHASWIEPRLEAEPPRSSEEVFQGKPKGVPVAGASRSIPIASASAAKRFPCEIPTTTRGKWSIEGDELVQSSREHEANILFGDPALEDLDFAVEAKLTDGVDTAGLWCRYTDRADYCFFGVGLFQNTWFHFASVTDGVDSPPRLSPPRSMKGSIVPGKWYRLEVRLRDRRAECFLDGVQILTFDSARRARGRIGLHTRASAYHFRNIVLKAPDGQILLEGLPDLDHADVTSARSGEGSMADNATKGDANTLPSGPQVPKSGNAQSPATNTDKDPPSKPAAGLTITQARWGGGRNWVDVTDDVRANVRDGRYLATAVNESFGDKDPTRGFVKSFVVQYSINGEPRSGTFGEGRLIYLGPDEPPPEQDAGLKLLEAKYGGANTWVDVLARLRPKVKKNLLWVRADSLVSVDPVPNVGKWLVVRYALNGEAGRAVVSGGSMLCIDGRAPTTISAEVDLLKKINPKRDSLRGDWQFKLGKLYMPAIDSAQLEIPYSFPDEYELTAIVESPGRRDTLTIGLPVAGAVTTLMVDAGPMTISGLSHVDGDWCKRNETGKNGTFMKEGPNTIVCQVRKGSIKVTCNDVVIVDWAGEHPRLSIGTRWETRDPRHTFLGAKTTPFVFTKLRLAPLAEPKP